MRDVPTEYIGGPVDGQVVMLPKMVTVAMIVHAGQVHSYELVPGRCGSGGVRLMRHARVVISKSEGASDGR